MNGYDESNYQGAIDNGVVPGDFVIIKATEGVGYVDPDCDPNYQQSKAAGKLLGVYHFARPDGNDPVSEAKWFVGQIGGYLGEAVLGLDLETQPITPGWAKTWLDTVYQLTQVRPVLYMSQSSFNNGDWSSVWPNYAAWVAAYGANNPQNGYGDPNAPVTINGDWTIFATQYTSQGKLPGWGGNLDLDVAYVTPDAWKKYAAGDRNQPAPVVPAPAPVVEPTPAPVVTPVEPPVTEPVVAPVAPVEPVSAPVESPVTPITVTHIPTPPRTIIVSQPKPSAIQSALKWILAFIKSIIGVK